MHVAQATACTMAFVVAIVTCLVWELLRTVVRTEPEWTFGDLYAILLSIKTQLRAKFSVYLM